MNLPSFVHRMQLSEFKLEPESAKSDLVNLFFRKLNITKLGVFGFGASEKRAPSLQSVPNLNCFKATHGGDIADEVPF